MRRLQHFFCVCVLCAYLGGPATSTTGSDITQQVRLLRPGSLQSCYRCDPRTVCCCCGCCGEGATVHTCDMEEDNRHRAQLPKVWQEAVQSIKLQRHNNTIHQQQPPLIKFLLKINLKNKKNSPRCTVAPTSTTAD